MALGTNIGMSPNGVHGRVVMVDGRDRFRAVTLPAGNPCPGRMKVSGLLRMAFDAGGSIIELKPSMGVR